MIIRSVKRFRGLLRDRLRLGEGARYGSLVVIDPASSRTLPQLDYWPALERGRARCARLGGGGGGWGVRWWGRGWGVVGARKWAFNSISSWPHCTEQVVSSQFARTMR